MLSADIHHTCKIDWLWYIHRTLTAYYYFWFQSLMKVQLQNLLQEIIVCIIRGPENYDFLSTSLKDVIEEITEKHESGLEIYTTTYSIHFLSYSQLEICSHGLWDRRCQ